MKVSDIVDFLFHAGRLKYIKRTGWVLMGIPEPESIADHTFRTALIAYILAEKIGGVNKEKVLRMALIHDLVESVTGDIPIEARRFFKMEETDAFSSIPGIGEDTINVFLKDFKEFQERASTEAMIVRAADKIELLLQVLDYENKRGASLESFWDNPDNRVDFGFHPVVEEIVREIERRRECLREGED